VRQSSFAKTILRLANQLQRFASHTNLLKIVFSDSHRIIVSELLGWGCAKTILGRRRRGSPSQEGTPTKLTCYVPKGKATKVAKVANAFSKK
jgi:hypothetical protein